MVIESIRLQNFRSHTASEYNFSPNVNIVVGPNASGKTNILEAVLVMAQGESYRAKDEELVEFNKGWARIDAELVGQNRVVKIIKNDKVATKEFVINDKPHKRLRFNDWLPTVYFEPNHLQLFVRGPEQRRSYFDDLLSRIDPDYKKLLNKYLRTLRQRNSLLKQPQAQASSQIFVWDIRLAEIGEQLVTARAGMVDIINSKLSAKYSEIAGVKSGAMLSYLSPFRANQYASSLIQKLEKNIELDFIRGFTTYGPHREDYGFELNNYPVGATASRGETRSVLLALKIIEAGLVEVARNEKPLLLFDDVFSELDKPRRKALVGAINGHQAILTTTTPDTIESYFKLVNHKILDLGS